MVNGTLLDGLKIKKQFKDPSTGKASKSFTGTVAYLGPRSQPYCFSVTYTDGDTETMTAEELLKHIQTKKAGGASVRAGASAGTPKGKAVKVTKSIKLDGLQTKTKAATSKTVNPRANLKPKPSPKARKAAPKTVKTKASKALKQKPSPKAPRAAPKAAKPKGPLYIELIAAAVTALKERGGSSAIAIKKHVQGTAGSLGDGWERRLAQAIKAMVRSGRLIKVKASYKLKPTKEERSAKASDQARVRKAAAAARDPVADLAKLARLKQEYQDEVEEFKKDDEYTRDFGAHPGIDKSVVELQATETLAAFLKKLRGLAKDALDDDIDEAWARHMQEESAQSFQDFQKVFLHSAS